MPRTISLLSWKRNHKSFSSLFLPYFESWLSSRSVNEENKSDVLSWINGSLLRLSHLSVLSPHVFFDKHSRQWTREETRKEGKFNFLWSTCLSLIPSAFFQGSRSHSGWVFILSCSSHQKRQNKKWRKEEEMEGERRERRRKKKKRKKRLIPFLRIKWQDSFVSLPLLPPYSSPSPTHSSLNPQGKIFSLVFLLHLWLLQEKWCSFPWTQDEGEEKRLEKIVPSSDSCSFPLLSSSTLFSSTSFSRGLLVILFHWVWGIASHFEALCIPFSSLLLLPQQQHQGIKETARKDTGACLCRDAVLLFSFSWFMNHDALGGSKRSRQGLLLSSEQDPNRTILVREVYTRNETDEKRIEKKGRLNDCYHATECFPLSLILCILFSSPSAVCVMLSHPLSPFIPFYLWCTTQI